MAARFWTCQRVVKGVKCAHLNPAVKRKCSACGKTRPKRKEPAHKAILKAVLYEQWEELFGQKCNICGRKPTAKRRLDRDHDHKTGKMRGLLCARCNRALPRWITPEWLESAAEYLKRAETLGLSDSPSGKL